VTRKSALIYVMEKAARKAARGLLRDFGEVEQLQVSKKGPANFVTTADLRTERLLVESLREARPDFGFLLEEGADIAPRDGRSRWIIDPLDGTTNFLHGIPHFAVSIALEQDQELIAGLILEPLRDELFWAERGVGAFLNSRRLRVSARGRLNQAVIATGIPHLGRPASTRWRAELDRLMPRVAGIRRFGTASLDLAYVAAGRYEAFWEHGLSAWDVAAGIVLVQEAGGLVSDLDDRQTMLMTGDIVAANDQLHRPLLEHLNAAAPAPDETA